MDRKPIVVAHRGLHTQYRENSIAGILAAVEQGYPVEYDLRQTRDGVFILHHDSKVRGNRRQIRSRTYPDLKEQHGERIERFEEVLERLPAGASQYIEIKDHDADTDRIITLLRSAKKLERSTLFSFHRQVLERTRSAPLPRWLLTLALSPQLLPVAIRRIIEPVSLAQRLGVAGIAMMHLFVRQGLVHRIHTAGLKLFSWTVNSSRAPVRLRQMGVDGIITDQPRRIRDAFQK